MTFSVVVKDLFPLERIFTCGARELGLDASDFDFLGVSGYSLDDFRENVPSNVSYVVGYRSSDILFRGNHMYVVGVALIPRKN